MRGQILLTECAKRLAEQASEGMTYWRVDSETGRMYGLGKRHTSRTVGFSQAAAPFRPPLEGL